DCAGCKKHVDTERADLELVRNALIAPPAPDLLKARIARALDVEDREAARAVRRKLSQWILPASATIAAAAAILMFVFVKPEQAANTAGSVAQEAVRQQSRAMPMEVQGASTGPWLREHFRPIEPPQFTEPGIQ